MKTTDKTQSHTRNVHELVLPQQCNLRLRSRLPVFVATELSYLRNQLLRTVRWTFRRKRKALSIRSDALQLDHDKSDPHQEAGAPRVIN